MKKAKDCEKFIREGTDVSADIGVRGPGTIIATGRYKGRDYVQVFDMRDEDLRYVVDMLKEMKRHHRVRAVDAPASMRSFIDV